MDQLTLGYIVINAALLVGFVVWFFLRLERIIARNGALDIFLNLILRLLPWQLGLYLAYLATFHLLEERL